jgi:hypothetical protein
MNPMVFTIAVRDHELEIQRDLKRKGRSGTGASSPNSRDEAHESRRSIWMWFKRVRRDSRQFAIECAEEGC